MRDQIRHFGLMFAMRHMAAIRDDMHGRWAAGECGDTPCMDRRSELVIFAMDGKRRADRADRVAVEPPVGKDGDSQLSTQELSTQRALSP